LAISGYACKIPKLPQREFEEGEGLIGQVMASRKTLFFNELPRDKNAEVSQTAVRLSPVALIVCPMMFNDEVYGIFELAYLNELETKYEQFLNSISKNIGAMLESIYNAVQMRKLLRETQEQAEILRSQEEEMRQNMEEMVATQEEMERKHMELEKMNKKMSANETILKKSLEKGRAQQAEFRELKAQHKALQEREQELLARIAELEKEKA
jgi:transcriptional regulator with GAF, ATPase, and Fis domain